MKWSLVARVLCRCCPVVGIVAKGYDVWSKPSRGPVEMFFKDHVVPVEGSVVCCKLLVGWEHSGIYIGDGKIIHRDGDGYLACVDADGFLARLNGKNPSITIFVSCRGDVPVGGLEIARRARMALSNSEMGGYGLLTKNCHQFCQYCVTGRIDNGIVDFTFTNLESVLIDNMGMDSWRVMEGCWRT